MAISVEDVVSRAGGWLYDRALAEWRVNVMLLHPGDVRPLQILGLGVTDIESGLASRISQCSQSLAVSAALIQIEDRIQQEVLMSLSRRLTEVIVWGDGVEFDGMSAVRYRLTNAARAFKTHAMRAAKIRDAVQPTERFIGRNSLPFESEFILG